MALIAAGLAVGTFLVTALVMGRIRWYTRGGAVAVVTAVTSTAGFLVLERFVPAWWALGVTVVLYLVALDRLAGGPDRRRLTRVARTVPPGRGIALASLPVTLVDRQHRPREGSAGCRCLAMRLGAGRTLVVTTTSVYLRGGDPVAIDDVRDLSLVATGLSLLQPMRRVSDVDGLPLPWSTTNRLRLVLADHSSLWFRSRPRHGAYQLLETFRRLSEDHTLRALVAVGEGREPDLDLPADLVTRLPDGTRVLTGLGLVELRERLRYNATLVRLLDPED